MVEASSPGRVSPKIKSIDVDANLLSERITERERHLEALSRRGLAGFGVLVFAIVALPTSYGLQGKMAERAHAVATREADAAKRLADRKAVLAALQPKMQSTAMLATIRGYSGDFLKQFASFTNSANSRMVFSGVKAEVNGGQVRLSGRADAESYGAAREFVDRLAKLPQTKSAELKQWRQNDEFAEGGVAFEVERVAEVGK